MNETSACVVTVWPEGTEFHTDDAVVAEVDWRFIEDEFRADMDLHGRSRETVGIFIQGEQGIETEVLVNEGREGKFLLSSIEAVYVYQHIEAGTLLGVWHTHPHGQRNPSEADWAGHPAGVPMYIVSVESSDTFMVMKYTRTTEGQED